MSATPDPRDGVPLFVVVGNVNQGKSSIVATLAEDETVPIDRAPGTTVKSGEYAFRIGERTVFRIFDTPGFQQARAALDWMKQRSRSAADRRQVVRDFVREHRASGAFADEVELLQPVLAGASILYVVDASARFQPSSEAEMEILRWTGQPGMALINRTRERDYAGEWRPILEQFFNVVREFDAHQAGFADRVALFQGFREVRQEWRTPMDEAIAAMQGAWDERRRRAAQLVAELMVDALSHVERARIEPHQTTAERAAALRQRFEQKQRDLERRARADVEGLYGHRKLVRREAALPLYESDLFSDTSWQLFGLTRGQLAKHGALWGGAIGLAIDLAAGGLSGFIPTMTGAGIGALAAWFGSTEIARTWGERSKLAQSLFPGDTGHFEAMGPATSPRYAWLLLDRALLHWRAVQTRAHARQDELELTPDAVPGGGKRGIVANLDSAQRHRIDEVLRDVLKGALRGEASGGRSERMAHALHEVMATL